DKVSQGYAKLLNIVKNDSLVIPNGNFVEIKFEDLEADPVNEIRNIYSRFQMPIDDTFISNLESFLNSLKTYKKNIFYLTESEKEMIRKHLSEQMLIFNYH
ncbi:MAG: sulfotransferase, partial [Bacteroidales bacterium]